MKLKNIFVLVIVFSLSFMGCKGISMSFMERIGSKVYIKMNNSTPRDIDVIFKAEAEGYVITFGGILNANTVKDFEINYEKVAEKMINEYGSRGCEGNLYAYINNEKKYLSMFEIFENEIYEMEYPKIEGVIKGGATTESAIYVEWSKK